MAKNNNLTDFLTDVADAIRVKKGTTAKINPQNFSSEIAGISTGSDTSDATATANDVLAGKTAYVASGKVTGTIETYDGSYEEIVTEYTDCLTFTGENGQDFTLKATNKEWDGTLEYSTDHTNWTTLSAAGVEMTSANGKLYLRGSGNTTFYTLLGVRWVLSAKAGCSGNIQTLLQYDNPPSAVGYACFNSLFYACGYLTASPELPATTLGEYSYFNMFCRCKYLVIAPELPAITLKKNCYRNMFLECENLKINSASGNKIFTCPTNIPSAAVDDMFKHTGGTFTGTPTAGTTYYYTV